MKEKPHCCWPWLDFVSFLISDQTERWGEATHCFLCSLININYKCISKYVKKIHRLLYHNGIYSNITMEEKPDCCPSRRYTHSAHSFPQSDPTTSDTHAPRTSIHTQLLCAEAAMDWEGKRTKTPQLQNCVRL